MLRFEWPLAEAWSSGAHPTLAWERSLYGEYWGVPGAGKSHRIVHLRFPRVSIKLNNGNVKTNFGHTNLNQISKREA